MKLTAIILTLSLATGCAVQPTQDFMTMSEPDTSPVAVGDVEANQADTAELSGMATAMLWIVLIAVLMASDHYSASYHSDGLYIRSDNLDE